VQAGAHSHFDGALVEDRQRPAAEADRADIGVWRVAEPVETAEDFRPGEELDVDSRR